MRVRGEEWVRVWVVDDWSAAFILVRGGGPTCVFGDEAWAQILYLAHATLRMCHHRTTNDGHACVVIICRRLRHAMHRHAAPPTNYTPTTSLSLVPLSLHASCLSLISKPYPLQRYQHQQQTAHTHTHTKSLHSDSSRLSQWRRPQFSITTHQSRCARESKTILR